MSGKVTTTPKMTPPSVILVYDTGKLVPSFLQNTSSLLRMTEPVFNKANPEEVESAMNAGATEFLPKITTTPVKLSERVNQYLSSR